MSYYTVKIPWVPAQQSTVWHPTEAKGPFSTLVRGVFKTREAAITWATTYLAGNPYTVEFIGDQS